MNSVNSLPLRDLLVETKDGDWGQSNPAEGLVPYHVIRATDFAAASLGDVRSVPLRFLPSHTVQRRTLQLNDVLIETAGGSPGRPTGRTMLVTQRVIDSFEGPVTCASFARFLRADPRQVDPRFLYWFLQALYQSGEIEQYQVQHTGVARFQYTQFAATQHVPVPEVAAQQAIAEVLGALDDKISTNTKLIKIADTLSHTLFRSMSQSGTQLIPLSETARFINGKAFTKNASGTGRVVIRIAELNSGIGGSTVYNDIDVDEQHLARPGDLLFAWSGSLTLQRWFRPEGIVNQHIFKVIPNGRPLWLVHELLRSKLEEFKSIAADKATTMGHIQRKHLDEPVALPTSESIRVHGDLMTGLWERSLAAEVESLQLAATRDTLLPQLMSGKLRVKDAEKVLEDAGV